MVAGHHGMVVVCQLRPGGRLFQVGLSQVDSHGGRVSRVDCYDGRMSWGGLSCGS